MNDKEYTDDLSAVIAEQIGAEELRDVLAKMTPYFGSEFSFQQIVKARRLAQERTDARVGSWVNGEGAE